VLTTVWKSTLSIAQDTRAPTIRESGDFKLTRMQGPTMRAASAPSWPIPPISARVTDAISGCTNIDTFRILFVCTGNVCRSVMAEEIAHRELAMRPGSQGSSYQVASAGTSAEDGIPVHPYTAEALTRFGIQSGSFFSRRLSGTDIDAADLILSAGQEHRDQVVAMRPNASRRAYLLKEFVRLAPFAEHGGVMADEVSRARCIVEGVAKLRGRLGYRDPATDEIPDPAATKRAFFDCANIIDVAVREVIDVLCDRRPPQAVHRQYD
jgi:protein-tyrosine phosphatase